MRNRSILYFVIAELVIAVAFAAASATVLITRKDDLWLQLVLVIGGIAGLLNGAYLLGLRNKRPTRKGPNRPKGKR